MRIKKNVTAQWLAASIHRILEGVAPCCAHPHSIADDISKILINKIIIINI